MLSVTIRDNGFSIFGHAEFAEYGSDIVCSAVSFLAQTLVKELERYAQTHAHQESGMMDVKVKFPHDPWEAERVGALLEYFENAVTLLAQQYPENIQIKKI